MTLYPTGVKGRKRRKSEALTSHVRRPRGDSFTGVNPVRSLARPSEGRVLRLAWRRTLARLLLTGSIPIAKSIPYIKIELILQKGKGK